MPNQETLPPVAVDNGTQVLRYPIDNDSSSVLNQEILTTKWPRTKWSNTGRLVTIKVLDDVTVLTTGDGKIIWHVPLELDNTLVLAAHAFVSTVSSSGAVTVQIRNVTDSVDLLSTAITIDANEYDSYTAAASHVVNFTNAKLSKSDRIAVDIDGAGTGAKGLSVVLSIQS